jgi:cysteine desulfurase/selenocysteine lyase
MINFDPHTIRKNFPIFDRVENGQPLVFLDSAASAQKPNQVIDAMANQMRHSYANVHRGLYAMANEVTGLFEQAREGVANFINSEPSEIIFTKSATEGFNLLAHCLEDRLMANDVILVSEMEHHANIVPWHMLCARKGARLEWVRINDDGVLDLEDLRAKLSLKPKIVALSHMSNVLGTINPIAIIAAEIKSSGALFVVDGCQSIVHLNVDVKALGCDFYSFSGHKLYGPTGIGVLYGRRDILCDMPPFLGGGEMIDRVSKLGISFADAPQRFEAGTPPIIEAIGLKAAIDWLNAQDRPAIEAHEINLGSSLRERLSEIKGLKIYGNSPQKGAIVSFTIDGIHAHDIAQILDQMAICVRAGKHCAEPLMERMGMTSSVRASFGAYNYMDEVDALVKGLNKAQKLLS